MNLREWLDATSINGRGITSGERQRRRIERADVLKAAATSISTLRNADSRGNMGLGLAKRLEAATAEKKAKFRVRDQMPELRRVEGI